MTGRFRLNWLNLSFILLMLALTGLFISLGVWQVERLAEKEALIAKVATQLTQAPFTLPTGAEFASLEGGALDYRPLRLTGRYLPADTVLVFTSLADPKGHYSGPGYWVMTPFAVDGGTVFINRGFVPQESAPAVSTEGTTPAGILTLTGIARASEQLGGFTPDADRANHIDWVRNTERLASFATDLPQPVASFYIDLPAGDPGTLPQGGETTVEFPNNHLGYAMTWFGFALLTPILLVFWVLRQRKVSGSQA